MAEENKNTCPHCPNHCTAQTVRCGRGASYFGLEDRSRRSYEDREGHGGRREPAGRGDHGEYGEQGGRGEDWRYREHGEPAGRGRHGGRGALEEHGEHRGHGKHDDFPACEHRREHAGGNWHPDGPDPHEPHPCGHPHHRHGGQDDAAAFLHNLEADTPESQLAARLRECGHHLYHNGLPRAGQLRILYILSESGLINQRRLQDILGVKPGSLSEILGKLENAGYIVRVKNEQDRRGVDISITDEGKEAMKALKRQHKDRMQGMFTALDEEEQQQLLALLNKLLDAWHGEREEG